MRETKFWAWHIISAVVICVLLGLHMVVMHMDGLLGYNNPAGPNAIDWYNVVARAQVVGQAAIYVVLLGAALFHGLYGARNILFEYSPIKGLQTFINVLFIAIGTGLFVYGSWAAIAALALKDTI